MSTSYSHQETYIAGDHIVTVTNTVSIQPIDKELDFESAVRRELVLDAVKSYTPPITNPDQILTVIKLALLGASSEGWSATAAVKYAVSKLTKMGHNVTTK